MHRPQGGGWPTRLNEKDPYQWLSKIPSSAPSYVPAKRNIQSRGWQAALHNYLGRLRGAGNAEMSAVPPRLKAGPAAIEDAWSWRIGARCRNEDPSLFFHPDGERGKARKNRQQLAKKICSECPVLEQCRQHSLAFQEAFGTWGGLSEDDRGRFLPTRAVALRTRRRFDQS